MWTAICVFVVVFGASFDFLAAMIGSVLTWIAVHLLHGVYSRDRWPFDRLA